MNEFLFLHHKPYFIIYTYDKAVEIITNRRGILRVRKIDEKSGLKDELKSGFWYTAKWIPCRDLSDLFVKLSSLRGCLKEVKISKKWWPKSKPTDRNISWNKSRNLDEFCQCQSSPRNCCLPTKIYRNRGKILSSCRPYDLWLDIPVPNFLKIFKLIKTGCRRR